MEAGAETRAEAEAILARIAALPELSTLTAEY